MPAFEKRSVGSLAGTRDEERTTRCPRAAKKSRKNLRMSFEVMVSYEITSYGLHKCGSGEHAFLVVRIVKPQTRAHVSTSAPSLWTMSSLWIKSLRLSADRASLTLAPTEHAARKNCLPSIQPTRLFCFPEC